MPGGDKTGPMGAGPRTGRAAGLCAGYDVPGYMNSYGRGGGGWGGGGRGGGGWGRGRGWGRGWGGYAPAGGTAPYGYAAPYGYGAPYPVQTPSKEAELEMLREQNKQLAMAIENIQERISQLEKEGD
jgi:hypothetical protein